MRMSHRALWFAAALWLALISLAQAQGQGKNKQKGATPNADPYEKGTNNFIQSVLGLNPTNPASVFRAASGRLEFDDARAGVDRHAELVLRQRDRLGRLALAVHDGRNPAGPPRALRVW